MRRWAAAVLVLWLLPTTPASALTAAERYAQRAGEEAMAIARAGGSTARIAARFQASMRRHADIPRLAAFSLGPYRRDLPASRQREFHRLVERFAGQVFASYHGDFVGRRMEVVGSRPLGRGDTLVRTRIEGGRSAAEIEWRIVGAGGRLKVFDLKVRGIWLTLQMRSHFVSILRRNEGSMDALFAYLRQQGPP
jgi:phospholipid transport system substrate-binding protein